jgi:hypothetical protein
MKNVEQLLKKIKISEPEVAQMFDTYIKVDKVYRDAINAMSFKSNENVGKNTSNITITFDTNKLLAFSK